MEVTLITQWLNLNCTCMLQRAFVRMQWRSCTVSTVVYEFSTGSWMYFDGTNAIITQIVQYSYTAIVIINSSEYHSGVTYVL